jgi:hypothetical protein
MLTGVTRLGGAEPYLFRWRHKGRGYGTRQWCLDHFAWTPPRSLWREEVLLPLPCRSQCWRICGACRASGLQRDVAGAVWPNTAVTEGVLKTCLGQIRRVLGDSQTPQYIATLYRRGYRFVAPVMNARVRPGLHGYAAVGAPDLPYPTRWRPPPALSPLRLKSPPHCAHCDLVGAMARRNVRTRKSTVRCYMPTTRPVPR